MTSREMVFFADGVDSALEAVFTAMTVLRTGETEQAATENPTAVEAALVTGWKVCADSVEALVKAMRKHATGISERNTQ